MVSVSVVFFVIYLGGVIALHGSARPLGETVGLIRDLLPERKVERASPTAVDAILCEGTLRYSEDAKMQPELVAVPRGAEAK
jgi:hypothetical protein